MSREEYEQSKKAWLEGEFSRGPSDPDVYGYPGEPKIIIKAEKVIQHEPTELDLSDQPF